MLKTEHFIAFFTTCGFFIGLIFVIVKIEKPVEFVLYTLLVTLFFYLVIHIIVIGYVDADKLAKQYFDKRKYEDINDYLISELSVREKRLESIVDIDQINKMMMKKQSKNNERTKAKAS